MAREMTIGQEIIEYYKEDEPPPVVSKQDCKLLFARYLEEEERCKDTGWYACIVDSPNFGGAVRSIGICSRSMGTDYIYPCFYPCSWKEIFEYLLRRQNYIA